MGVRATRALVGAIGAGISLAVASSLMLFVVSSVIAFNGWPDDLSGTAEPEIAALLGAAASSVPAERAVVALAQPVATSPHGDDRAESRRSAAAGSDEDGGLTSGGGGGGASPPDNAPSGPSPDPGGASGATARAEPADQVRAAVGQTTDAVRDTTSAVAEVVAPVAPSVSGALQSVGAAGADAVDGVAQRLLP